MASTWWLDDQGDAWTATDAGATLLTYAIAIAERGPEQVALKDYKEAHQRLFSDHVARRVADKVLVRAKTPDLLWSHLRSIATGSGSWQLRRNGAHRLIDPVLEAVHNQTESPIDDLVTGATARLDAESVKEAWSRALERRDGQPEGAVTIARTLLESTLKTILDDREIAYEADDDVPALYRAVSAELSLAPGSYSEQAFKQILGGCHSVVVGVGSLRTRQGMPMARGGRPIGQRRGTPLSPSISPVPCPCS